MFARAVERQLEAPVIFVTRLNLKKLMYVNTAALHRQILGTSASRNFNISILYVLHVEDWLSFPDSSATQETLC